MHLNIDRRRNSEAAPPQSAFTYTKPTYTILETVDFLGSRATVYKLINSGELAIVKIGRRTFIPADSIASLIERRRRAA